MTSPAEQIIGLYWRHARAWAAMKGEQREKTRVARLGADKPHGSRLERRQVWRYGMRQQHGWNSLEKGRSGRMVGGLNAADAVRRGWTTGVCATAAARGAYEALVTGVSPDPVEVVQRGGQRPQFPLSHEKLGPNSAEAGAAAIGGHPKPKEVRSSVQEWCANGLTEILREAAGVNVTQTGGRSSATTVTSREGQAGQVLVVIDCVPIGSPAGTDGSLDSAT